jgi:hypothetical protein
MVQTFRFRYGVAPALALSLAGCSTHPLPENHPLSLPRASTFDIVQRARCEAKAALEPLRRGKRKAHVDKIVASTSIGYYFSFVITERNNATGGSLDFTKPWAPPSGKTFTLDLSGEAARSRKNTRHFTIIEDLADVASIKAGDCPEAVGTNVAYPISGSLGIDEVVRSYIGVERVSDLDEDVVAEGAGKAVDETRAGVFSEVLHFNTRLNASATPTLTLNTVPGRFRLTSASATGVVERTDNHTLIIAFAQDKGFKDDEFNKKRAEARSQGKRYIDGKARKLEGGRRYIRGAHTEAAFAQASTKHAHNQVALELSRQRNLLEDREDGARFLGDLLLKGLRPPDENGLGD